MKCLLLLPVCALLYTTTIHAQSQVDVSAWLTETQINGVSLQVLRAPADQLTGNTKFDIIGYQKALDKFRKFYNEGKEIRIGQLDTSYDFVRVQNPAWPLQYYQQEVEAYKAYNQTWKVKAVQSNLDYVKHYNDSIRIAALVAGQVFINQPFALLKEEPADGSLTLGKVYQYSYVAFNGRVENTDWVEVTVASKHTGYIKAGDIVNTIDALHAPAEKLEKMEQVRLYDFEPGATYQARLNKEAAEDAAQLKAMNSVPKRKLIRGPQGGCYFVNASGNKEYVDRGLCK